MRVTVIHEISETYRELYEFEVCSTYIIYEGIYFSYRNDRFDVWGDEWNHVYEEDRKKAMDAVAKEFPDEEYEGFRNEMSPPYRRKLTAIEEKYNPVLNKTKAGKTYFSGHSATCDQLERPKLTEKELRARILEEVEKKVKNVKFYL